MGRPHILVIPLPTQGHVMPLMELSHKLVDYGFKITFVNTEHNHNRVVSAFFNRDHHEDFIDLVSIPDGMEEGEDRNQHVKMLTLMTQVMPGHLENLIKKINESNNEEDKIRCVIADEHIGWALEVAERMSILKVAFWPASIVYLATKLAIPKLIQDGIISVDGNLIKNEVIQLSAAMPAINTTDLYWLCVGDPMLQKTTFDLAVHNNESLKCADYFIGNTFYELEPSILSLVPNFRPIGPLITNTRFGHFWPEDSTCLSWLDKQPPHSVIFVAFGSFTLFDKRQFQEIAFGLELSGQPFLWVVRPDIINEFTDDPYPKGFKERVGLRGCIVDWAPQAKVLAHSSVGCFLTHCGWNSTIEGISNGIPLLCWPYFFDQIINKLYICEVWKNGLGLEADENGIISREEIKIKTIDLLGNGAIKESARKWKEIAINNVKDGGVSSKNFQDFVQAIKEV